MTPTRACSRHRGAGRTVRLRAHAGGGAQSASSARGHPSGGADTPYTGTRKVPCGSDNPVNAVVTSATRRRRLASLSHCRRNPGGWHRHAATSSPRDDRLRAACREPPSARPPRRCAPAAWYDQADAVGGCHRSSDAVAVLGRVVARDRSVRHSSDPEVVALDSASDHEAPSGRGGSAADAAGRSCERYCDRRRGQHDAIDDAGENTRPGQCACAHADGRDCRARAEARRQEGREG
jgi:hypothetical protein